MDNIKINLVILTRGASMMSEQECSKQLKKPVINQRGKYAGKQARDKNGNFIWYYKTVPDLSKYDRHDIKWKAFDPSTKKTKIEVLTYYTRKQKEIKQSINMTQEAYEYFISNEMPATYHAPKSFKPYAPTRSRLDRKSKKYVEGIPIDIQAWKAASPKERLEWHLKAIASDLRGEVVSYTVFED